jgi:thioredoxin-dependent peroxiredoxin
MALHIGSYAPNFQQESTDGPLDFYTYLGESWGVLFSHPKDFTPVCTTELGRASKLKPEFDRRRVKLLALSVDDLNSHISWAVDIAETQRVRLNFPLLADSDRKVSTLYDMVHAEADDTATVRSVFFIDPLKKIRTVITYPASTGRNFDEILRVIDSLQLADKHKVATPADWKQGEDVVIAPSVQDPEELQSRFPKGFRSIKPYLRLTPQPAP